MFISTVFIKTKIKQIIHICIFQQNNMHWLSIPREKIMHWLPIPGEDSNYVKGRKNHHHDNHQAQKSKHFCQLDLGIRVTKEKTMQSSIGRNKGELTQRRDSNISFNSAHSSLMTSRSLLAGDTGQFTSTAPLLCHMEGPCPHSVGTDIAVGLARCRMLKQNKEVLIELKQEQIFLAEVISPAQAVQALYLLVRKGSRPKNHLYVARGRGCVK